MAHSPSTQLIASLFFFLITERVHVILLAQNMQSPNLILSKIPYLHVHVMQLFFPSSQVGYFEQVRIRQGPKMWDALIFFYKGSCG